MFFQFNDAGILLDTPYWQSEEARKGRPVCTVRDGVWHVLMPAPGQRYPQRYQPAVAMPVRSSSEPEGWLWKIWITREWPVRLPLSCFEGPPPPLPDPGAKLDRSLVIYGHWLPGISQKVIWSFGNMPESVPIEYRTTLRVCRIARRRHW
jgi:hypothetical protein